MVDMPLKNKETKERKPFLTTGSNSPLRIGNSYFNILVLMSWEKQHDNCIIKRYVFSAHCRQVKCLLCAIGIKLNESKKYLHLPNFPLENVYSPYSVRRANCLTSVTCINSGWPLQFIVSSPNNSNGRKGFC